MAIRCSLSGSEWRSAAISSRFRSLQSERAKRSGQQIGPGSKAFCSHRPSMSKPQSQIEQTLADWGFPLLVLGNMSRTWLWSLRRLPVLVDEEQVILLVVREVNNSDDVFPSSPSLAEGSSLPSLVSLCRNLVCSLPSAVHELPFPQISTFPTFPEPNSFSLFSLLYVCPSPPTAVYPFPSSALFFSRLDSHVALGLASRFELALDL